MDATACPLSVASSDAPTASEEEGGVKCAAELGHTDGFEEEGPHTKRLLTPSSTQGMSIQEGGEAIRPSGCPCDLPHGVSHESRHTQTVGCHPKVTPRAKGTVEEEARRRAKEEA